MVACVSDFSESWFSILVGVLFLRVTGFKFWLPYVKSHLVDLEPGHRHTKKSFVMMTCGCARACVSEPLNMLRSAHTSNMHVKMTYFDKPAGNKMT